MRTRDKDTEVCLQITANLMMLVVLKCTQRMQINIIMSVNEKLNSNICSDYVVQNFSSCTNVY